MLLPAAGCGAEAAIGQLTRLTRLDLSIHRQRIDMAPADGPGTPQRAPQLSCGAVSSSAYVPLQVQLLGCGRLASAADGSVGVPDCHSSVGSKPTAQRNTGLQELDFQCTSWLTDDELAAVAAALPDLRQLSVVGGGRSVVGGGRMEEFELRGLTGAGLAAFTACRRLRDIRLPYSVDLDGQQLVAQLARLTSLTSIDFTQSYKMGSSAATELRAMFQAEPRVAAICKWNSLM